MSLSVKQVGGKFQVKDGSKLFNFWSLQEAYEYINSKKESTAQSLMESQELLEAKFTQVPHTSGKGESGHIVHIGVSKETLEKHNIDAPHEKDGEYGPDHAFVKKSGKAEHRIHVYQSGYDKDKKHAILSVRAVGGTKDRHADEFAKQLGGHIYGKSPLDESERGIEESLSKSAPPEDWIHDFINSKNPKFEGKSKEKRREMAIAAWEAKQNESEEHDDEKEDKALIKKLVKKDALKESKGDVETLKSHMKEAGYENDEGTIHHAVKVGNKIHFAAHDPESGHFSATFHIRGKGGEFGNGTDEDSHKSKEEAIEAVNKKASLKEDDLQELSKATLGSYVKKASSDMANKGAKIAKKQADADEIDRYTNRHGIDQSKTREDMHKAVGSSHTDIANARMSANKRAKNIGKAVDRLTKESTDTFKSFEYQIEESYSNLMDSILSLHMVNSLSECKDSLKTLIINKVEAAFEANDFSSILEDYTRQDVEDSIEAHKKAGNKVSNPSYTKKDGKFYAQYSVKDQEGNKKLITVHGASKKAESIAESVEDGGFPYLSKMHKLHAKEHERKGNEYEEEHPARLNHKLAAIHHLQASEHYLEAEKHRNKGNDEEAITHKNKAEQHANKSKDHAFNAKHSI